MRDYHYGVYIGRFQPFHIGHEYIVREALEKVETLILIVGSAYQARTPINPFTYAERQEMIRSVFSHEVASGRLIIVPMIDQEHDADWVEEVKTTVNAAILDHGNKGGVHLHGLRDFKTVLAGFGKDASSFYLDMFPDWGSIQIETQHGTINASDIREDYIRRLPHLPHDAVHPRILAFLKGFSLSNEFKRLVIEHNALERDQKLYGKGPFMCADALVTWRNKVLLVTRGGEIGHGLFAMPGGFVEEGERTFDACIRELGEETKLNGKHWGDFFVTEKLADKPNRSLRGRVYSQVHYFAIPAQVEVERPVGADDAKHADWYDFHALPREQFFDDHYNLIRNIIRENHI